MIMNKEYDFNNIIAHFLIDGELLDCERYGEGHINDTFRITVGQGGKSVHYILQRINHRLFTDVDKLMHNIGLVTEFCRNSVEREGGDPMRECLNIVRTREGKAYYFDGSNYFRVYVFIENATTYQTARHSRDFYESAVAFGKFVRLLADFDASQLYELLPGFHNTKVRYADFLRAVEKDSYNRRAEIAGEIDWVIAHKDLCGRIVDKLDSGEIPFRVTHNDTKLNNVMLDDATGKGIAVIDLDTVMPGSLCYDFGDSIRFGCSSAAEDEPDLSKVFFRYELYETYLRGYLHAVGDCITKEELENLPIGAIVITYECGMRFLTDYLEGDIYFRTTRLKQNLDRARTQFKLVEDMLLVFDKMCKTVEEVCHVTGAREQSILSA